MRPTELRWSPRHVDFKKRPEAKTRVLNGSGSCNPILQDYESFEVDTITRSTQTDHQFVPFNEDLDNCTPEEMMICLSDYIFTLADRMSQLERAIDKSNTNYTLLRRDVNEIKESLEEDSTSNGVEDIRTKEYVIPIAREVSKRPVKAWLPREVANFLRSMPDLQMYATRFEANSMDGEAALLFPPQDLTVPPISMKMGHALKFKHRLARLC